MRVPGAADGDARILAAPRGIQRDLGEISRATRMLRPFERQRADRAEGDAVLLAEIGDTERSNCARRSAVTSAEAR